MADQHFHRVESTTQTIADAKLQEASQEVWGREARGSGLLRVKAYRGPLPSHKRGIDFTTLVLPKPGDGTPFEAAWYYPDTPGTELRILDGVEFAAIRANVQNRQP